MEIGTAINSFIGVIKPLKKICSHIGFADKSHKYFQFERSDELRDGFARTADTKHVLNAVIIIIAAGKAFFPSQDPQNEVEEENRPGMYGLLFTVEKVSNVFGDMVDFVDDAVSLALLDKAYFATTIGALEIIDFTEIALLLVGGSCRLAQVIFYESPYDPSIAATYPFDPEAAQAEVNKRWEKGLWAFYDVSTASAILIVGTYTTASIMPIVLFRLSINFASDANKLYRACV